MALPIIRKRNHYLTEQQKQFLVDYMQSNPRLNSGKQCGDYTNKIMHDEWNQLASQLNALGGARKDGKGWKKSWQDIRRSTKLKATEIKTRGTGTGGGPSLPALNPFQEKVAALLGSAVIHGHETVEESTCQFNFDETEEHKSNDDDEDVVSPLVNPKSPKSDGGIHILQVIPLTNQMQVETNTPNSLPTKNKTTNNVAADIKSESNRNNNRKIKSCKRRLEDCSTATTKIAENCEKKMKIKEAYYNKKLELLERQVVALENLSHCLNHYLAK